MSVITLPVPAALIAPARHPRPRLRTRSRARRRLAGRRLWTGLLLCLVLLCWVPGAAARSAVEEGVLWSLHRDGQLAGYLLGTIHSEDPRVLDFDPDFLDRLGSCQVFAMELVPDLPTLQRLTGYMRLPPGQDLAGLLGAERYRAVAAALDRYGVPPEQVDTMKPWAAMMTLSVPPPRSGLFMDFSLSLRAAGRGLRVEGLETLEEQLSFLEELPLERQLELLDHAVAESDRVREVHRRMVDTYLQGSLAELERQALEQMADLDSATRTYFFDRGVTQRNRLMARRAVELLGAETVMIAVGALHLPGSGGLIALLRQAGFEVRPLPPPFTPAAGAVDSGAQGVAAELGRDDRQGAGRQ